MYYAQVNKISQWPPKRQSNAKQFLLPGSFRYAATLGSRFLVVLEAWGRNFLETNVWLVTFFWEGLCWSILGEPQVPGVKSGDFGLVGVTQRLFSNAQMGNPILPPLSSSGRTQSWSLRSALYCHQLERRCVGSARAYAALSTFGCGWVVTTTRLSGVPIRRIWGSWRNRSRQGFKPVYNTLSLTFNPCS